MEDINAQVGKKNDNGQMWPQRRHLGEMGHFKKVENYEYQVSAESIEEVDVEIPKLCDGNRNWLSTLTNGHTVTDVTGINQVNTGSHNRMVMSNFRLDISEIILLI